MNGNEIGEEPTACADLLESGDQTEEILHLYDGEGRLFIFCINQVKEVKDG